MKQIFALVFLIILILSACKSSKGKDFNSGEVLNDKIIVLQLDVNCQSQEELNLLIDNNSYVLVQPKLCDIFGDYITSGKIVSLHLTGKFNDSIFNIYDGSYGILEYDSINKSLSKVKAERLSFGSIDFIKDLREYRKSISYRIASSDFKLIKKDANIKSETKARYKLIYILGSGR
ncbi:hypothetical protein [Aquimarina sp. 2201CG5-10]|uniref:hypothetical protein n=1 Tax=Aquimarina callyspongiae TaxID=3098150 RepID=UPI002AB416FA|nr:hypothetical protein [Aquimarina sp. 2201CG5-10]MDY8137208.1 hypothetical protein [Aquimarina sp. 2201CG5-10]